MRLKEQRLWDAVKRNSPSTWWLQRVENAVGEGMPDVYAVRPDGLGIWIELKAATSPKKLNTRLLGTEGLRQSQVGWHLKAATKKLPAFILIRDDKGLLYCVPCNHAQDVNQLSTEQMREDWGVADWAGLWSGLGSISR